MLVDAATARRLRDVVRLVKGTLALAAARFLLGRLGTDPDQDPSGRYPCRLFGVRSVLIGADRYEERTGKTEKWRSKILERFIGH